MNDMTIPLSRGYVAIVDADDYEILVRHKWKANKTINGHVYACRVGKKEDGDKCGSFISMHRMITGVHLGSPKIHIDHINGDTLDNRRANLRTCRPCENARNLKEARCKAGMRGMLLMPNGKWRVRIRADGTLINVGYFDTERDASVAYCFASKHLHGAFGSTPGHEKFAEATSP